ncbi:hypothetical protein CAEBREN_02698 [Caenorhabditis brenneri]|uniref:BTB domain-containing protein n=1 Tax=Caenorhabditis brenneri TaxID=135651 RepID=G0P031_CAEBE|nr:hypothetical protein CAEBREN_02698 [Caenorhabditis brenneri]
MCSPDDTIKLNVGGSSVFQSTHSTLTRFNGYFKILLGAKVPVEKSRFGYIFIDRDPTHFRLVLNFMRDGDVDLPDSSQEIREVLREAQFYRLDGLVKNCQVKLQNFEIKIEKKLPVLESYDQVLQVITNPEKPVIIIYFPHGPDGTIDVPFNPTEFIKRSQKDSDIYFKRIEYNTPLPHNSFAFWQWRIYYKDKSYQHGKSSLDFGKKLDEAVAHFKKNL